MIKSNRVSKYVLYAIGEIFLVVVGILIALAINDLYDKNQLKKDEHNLLLALKSDFEESKNNVESTIARQRLVVKACHRLIKKMRKKESTFDSLSLYIYYGAFSYWRIEPVNGTYDALIGSGKTGIFSNEDLKQLLAEYSSKIKYGFEDETMALSLTSSLINSSSSYSSYFQPNLNPGKVDRRLLDISEDKKANLVEQHLNNEQFLGFLIMKSVLEGNRLEYQQDIMGDISKILDILNAELEIHNSDFLNTGQEDVVIQGILPKNVAISTASNLGFDAVKTDAKENYIEFEVEPGLEWAAAMFVVDSLGQNIRAGKDYSEYKSIQVELRSDQEGEEIMLSLKDKFDKDDGTEARVDIRLSQEWKTYRFNLEESFPTADLSNLHQLAGFVILNPKGLKIYVRNIKFLKE